MNLPVLCHNVWVGQKRESARRNLAALERMTGFDLALLQEAKALDGNILDGFVNHTGPASMGADYDNCRVLWRRSAFDLIDSGAWKVPGPMWSWNDNRKPTRVEPWAALRHKASGMVVIPVSIHRIPGGPVTGIKSNQGPWDAEHAAIVREVRKLLTRWPDAVVILGGDWNAKADERPAHRTSLASLARDLGAHMVVKHIDGFLVVGGRAERVEKLDGKHGSDAHRPVVGRIVVAPAPRRK